MVWYSLFFSPLLEICNVTHLNESCHAHENLWMRHVTQWRCHVTDMTESCHIYEWAMSHVYTHSTRENMWCAGAQFWHIWINHVAYVNTYAWVMSNMNAYEWVKSLIWSHSYKWLMSRLHTHTHTVYLNTSHIEVLVLSTYQWVMSHI